MRIKPVPADSIQSMLMPRERNLSVKPKTKTAKSATRPKRPAPLGIRVEPEAQFLAVDLEIVSRRQIDQLAPAFGDNVGINRNEQVGKDHILLLSTGGKTPFSEDLNKMINQTILMQVKLVHKLPEVARKQWDDARTKTFDIGIQAGGGPHVFEVRLTKQTILAVSAVGGCIQFTICGAVW
jgi:hypothetical protein